MRRLAPVALLLVVPAFSCLAAEPPKAEVQHIVDQFQASLKAHDAKTLESLFLPQGTSWFTTLGEPSFSNVKAKHPEAPRYKAGTVKEFVDYVGSSKGAIEERFHDIRIDTDGAVASVYFDFEFVVDGKVGNHGAETWQMIHTNDGWKIAAMLYSSNF